jgi:Tfp pilus assembly protein PilN
MNWSLLQSGIGIDIQGGNFTALFVKRQWKRIRVAGRLEIPQYEQAGPRECGKRYRQFLRKNGLKTPWTVVALPRSAVLLRWLNFPAAVEKELGPAVEYQLDSLHPFEEGSVCWDFAAWKAGGGASQDGGDRDRDRVEVPVAIAEKKYIDDTVSWFEEAGIGVSQFSVSSAVLMAALYPRLGMLSAPESGTSSAFFLLHAAPGSLQLLAYTPGSFVSKEVPLPPGAWEPGDEMIAAVERELDLARSELRLAPEQRPPLIVCGKGLPPGFSNAFGEGSRTLPFAVCRADHLFAALHTDAEGFRLQEDAVAFAAALTAADRTLPFSVNLLPPARRSYQSGLVYVPAYALSGVIVLLAVALGLRGTIQDWRYERYILSEIQSLEPQLKEVEAVQDQSRKANERLALLSGTRSTATLPMEVLDELTRLLPDDAWLQSMQYDGDSLSLYGFAKSASPLLGALSNSSYFESPQFLSAISKAQDGKEIFRIGARIRKSK